MFKKIKLIFHDLWHHYCVVLHQILYICVFSSRYDCAISIEVQDLTLQRVTPLGSQRVN